MILYHGSYTEIKKIDLSKAIPQKDFGKGFYTTNIRGHAENMAKKQGVRRKCKGIVTGFDFNYDTAFLSGNYKTKKFDGYTKEWLDFIELNRTNEKSSPAHGYDIVEGAVADDDVVQRMPDYIRGAISAEEFLKELKYKGGNTHQICFCTEKSLDTLERINIASHMKIGKIASFVISYLVISDKISENEAENLYYESETCKNVLDDSTGLYLKTGKEIYEMLKLEMEKSKKS
jgi:hypothetical protein